MGTSKYLEREDIMVTLLAFVAVYLYLVAEAYRDAFFVMGLIVLLQLSYIFDMLRRMYREGR